MRNADLRELVRAPQTRRARRAGGRATTLIATATALFLIAFSPLRGQEPVTRDPVPEAPGTSIGTAPEAPGTLVPSRDRSTIRLRFDCRSEIGRREITLFANGTVRVKAGIGKDERIELGELDPDQLTAIESRLGEVDLSEDDEGGQAVVVGPWVEQCRLDLLTAADKIRTFSFSKAAALSLTLDRLTKIADELAGNVRPELPGDIPAGYEPRSGDELIRADGQRFRVVALTVDGKAVELEQLEEPLVIYVPVGELRALFVRLERRP
jgi:hypothetical protein